MTREVDYLEDISSDRARVRARFTMDAGIVIKMTVQLEVLHDDDWKPARRYDDAHGDLHMDVLDPDGNEYRKVWLDIGRNEAVPLALRDFYENRERYPSGSHVAAIPIEERVPGVRYDVVTPHTVAIVTPPPAPRARRAAPRRAHDHEPVRLQ